MPDSETLTQFTSELYDYTVKDKTLATSAQLDRIFDRYAPVFNSEFDIYPQNTENLSSLISLTIRLDRTEVLTRLLDEPKSPAFRKHINALIVLQVIGNQGLVRNKAFDERGGVDAVLTQLLDEVQIDADFLSQSKLVELLPQLFEKKNMMPVFKKAIDRLIEHYNDGATLMVFAKGFYKKLSEKLERVAYTPESKAMIVYSYEQIGKRLDSEKMKMLTLQFLASVLNFDRIVSRNRMHEGLAILSDLINEKHIDLYDGKPSIHDVVRKMLPEKLGEVENMAFNKETDALVKDEENESESLTGIGQFTL